MRFYIKYTQSHSPLGRGQPYYPRLRKRPEPTAAHRILMRLLLTNLPDGSSAFSNLEVARRWLHAVMSSGAERMDPRPKVYHS